MGDVAFYGVVRCGCHCRGGLEVSKGILVMQRPVGGLVLGTFYCGIVVGCITYRGVLGLLGLWVLRAGRDEWRFWAGWIDGERCLRWIS